MTKPPRSRSKGNSGSAPKAKFVWTDETDKVLVDLLEETISGRTVPFEILKVKEELIRRTHLSQKVVNTCYPIAIERYLKDETIALETRIRMAYLAKAIVPEQLQNEIHANGVAKFGENESNGQKKLKKFVSSNPLIASVPEQVPQPATRNPKASENHVIIPSNDQYANSNGAFHGNAQINNAHQDFNPWNYSFNYPYANSSSQHHLPPQFYSSQNPSVPVNGQFQNVAPMGQHDPNSGSTGFEGLNAGSYTPQYMENYPGHSQNYPAPNHFGQGHYVHPSWALQNGPALYGPPERNLLDLGSSARQPNERGVMKSAASIDTRAQEQDMFPAPPHSVQQPTACQFNPASVNMMCPTPNEIESASNLGNQRASSLPRGSEVPANEASPCNIQIKTEIKQEPDETVAAKRRGAAGGSERGCKKSRTEESAKVVTPLPTPSRTSYQFLYDFLKVFEEFKGVNPYIKEFMNTLLETTMSRKEYLEKKTLSIDIIEYVTNVALDESIRKASVLEELEKEELIDMEMEKIPLNAFILKLRDLVNFFVSISPVSGMVALAKKMDKILDEGVPKNGVIVDTGKLGITPKEAIECLKFAKSTSELIPEL